MSVHQFIYTSCNKGIEDALKNIVGDGQKLYSKDEHFNDEDYQYITSSMFAYQPPVSSSVKMTDEILATFPKSFKYTKLNNGHMVFIDNVYGKDYTGRRYGNVFRHCLLFDSSHDLTMLPVELCKSPIIREKLSKEEAYREDTPEYLPELCIDSNNSEITFVKAMNFINSSNGRKDVLKSIIFAVLNHASTKKQVILCDTQDNIIYWIASISYLLPKKCVTDLTFNTYVYNPISDTDSIILGVFERDTQYNVEDTSLLDKYYVYDMVHNHVSLFDDDVLSEYKFFQDLDDIIMDRNQFLIEDFSQYLSNNTSYSGLDMNILNAYSLFVLYRDLEDDLEDTSNIEYNVSCLIETAHFVKDYLVEEKAKEQFLETMTDNLNALENINIEDFDIMAIYKSISICCELSGEFLEGIYALPIRLLISAMFLSDISLSHYQHICDILEYYKDDEQTFFDYFQSCIYQENTYDIENISFEKVAILYDKVASLFQKNTFQSCITQISRCYVPQNDVQKYIKLVQDKSIELDASLTVTISNMLTEIYPNEKDFIWSTFSSIVMDSISPDNINDIYSLLVILILNEKTDKSIIQSIYQHAITHFDDVLNQIELYFARFVALAKHQLFSISEIYDFIRSTHQTIETNNGFKNNEYTITIIANVSELLTVVNSLMLDGNQHKNHDMKLEIIKILKYMDRKLILSKLYTDKALIDKYSQLEENLVNNGIDCNTLSVAKIINYKSYGVKNILDIVSIKHLIFNQTLNSVVIYKNTRKFFKIVSKDIINAIGSDEEFRIFMSFFKNVEANCYSSLINLFVINAIQNEDTAHKYRPLEVLIRYLSTKLDDESINEIVECEPFQDIQHNDLKVIDKHILNSLSNDKDIELWNRLKRKKNIFGKLFN